MLFNVNIYLDDKKHTLQSFKVCYKSFKVSLILSLYSFSLV